MRAPDLVAPIVGYRAWLWDRWIRIRLRSFGNGTPWPRRRALEAFCPFWGDMGEVCLSQHCSCGIHAFKTAEQLLGALSGPMGELVLGEVYLWGKVVEHERGWRAQFAYPKRLVVLPDMPKEDIQTLVAYGVEISVTALNQLAAAWVNRQQA